MTVQMLLHNGLRGLLLQETIGIGFRKVLAKLCRDTDHLEIPREGKNIIIIIRFKVSCLASQGACCTQHQQQQQQ